MQHVQKIHSLTGQHTALAPLRVTTVQLSRWERMATRVKATGMMETVTEGVLTTTTFLMMSGLLFALYRALEQYTIVPLP
ncbi:MAG: hypothetical protein FJ147_16600 [Deltaproteobacteria bacterium]|nr:hypothetical protein [Deltaproteobacteria bacterium]